MNLLMHATGALAILLTTAALSAQTVTKVAEPFDTATWKTDQWNRAGGGIDASPEKAPGSTTNGCMDIRVEFSGNGFEHFAANPPQTLYFPGDVKSITLRIKRSDEKYGCELGFVDGWGRTKVNGSDLKLGTKFKTVGQWETHTYNIPADWVRPVGLRAITTHNWNAKTTEKTLHLMIDDLEVTTDITNVDPATGLLRTWKPNPDDDKAACPATRLLDVAVQSDDAFNLFSRKQPGATVNVTNWYAGKVSGKVSWTISEFEGSKVNEGSKDIAVEAAESIPLPLDVKRFGVYTAEVKVDMSNGQSVTQSMKFGKFPPYRELTKAQKLASPYGMNVHSGNGVVVNPFRRAGVIWFRDYAFSYEWLTRAKGPDRKYDAWPWYDKIMADYAREDVEILACLMGAIDPPKMQGDKVVSVGPDDQWVRNIADILLKFDAITYWEMDNEYDLNPQNRAAEDACDWRNYGAYHRKLGEIVKLIGGGKLTATQNGCAGIHPDWVERHVKRGDFDDIGVVNSHHYCGVDAPEINIGNFNTGFAGSSAEQPGLYFDQLRTYKRMGQLDGKPRQSWHTEFGWDALAGRIVSRYEQAVYLPRAWMVGMAAGTDKMFWFYHFDSPNPDHFFDGMGLLDANRQPNLCMASLAAMAYLMPTPKYVGEINVGEGTQGYVFEQDGQLVAALWSISSDEGPAVTFKADQLYDYLGNEISGNRVKLSRAPVYAVGFSKADPLYAQTAYSIDTNHLIVATAGAPIEPIILVDNQRSGAIAGQIRMTIPSNWKTTAPMKAVSVAAGSAERIAMPFQVDVSESLGMKEVWFDVVEGGKTIKRMKQLVLVQPQMLMEVGALSGAPGETTVNVKLKNLSAESIDAALNLKLPASWKAGQAVTNVKALKPGEVREVKLPLTWSAAWAPSETATLELTGPQGLKIAQPIIPSQFQLHQAGHVQMDGKLDDWSESQKIPTWMLGSSLGEPRADVYLAWAAEGLYGAVRVTDSQVQATDPRSFWSGDVVELWIDTRAKKGERKFEPGDHQFWLVPQVDKNSVYVGQWKRGTELSDTRFDIPNVKSAARRIEGGYIMEFLLPASELTNFNPAVGSSIGLNVNVSVKNKQFDREVYWSRRKNDGMADRPDLWGTVKLTK